MIGRGLSGLSLLSTLAGGVLALGAAACTPQIGNSCTLNTDCSIDNSRQCDNSQPNGYCTVFNCSPNTCPNSAVCVELQANVPGCPYDDYSSPSRGGRSMCLKPCNHDSDCRQGDGYRCLPVSGFADSGVTAIILDQSPQSQSVCAVAPDLASSAAATAPVCPGATVPEAGVIPTPDSGPDSSATADAGTDATMDAAVSDAPADVAPETAADATEDGPADATLEGNDGGVDSAAGG
jgi:hypothetical protein